MTEREKQVRDFVRDYVRERGGVSPSFREIMESVGFSSKSEVYRVLRQMREKGTINFMDEKWRTITLKEQGNEIG